MVELNDLDKNLDFNVNIRNSLKIKNVEADSIHPRNEFIRLTKIIRLIWLIFIFGSYLFFVFYFWDKLDIWVYIIVAVIELIFIILPTILIVLWKYVQIQYFWDEMDETGFKRYLLNFKTSDGLELYCKLLVPESFDLVNDKPIPALIGLHGWAGHHKRTDRFCIPSARKNNWLYFSFDARGHGKSPGKKNDLKQAQEAREFIDFVLSLPYVNNTRVGVVGFSLGAVKAAASAYPHPKIKSVIMLSGAYDLDLSIEKMSISYKILFWLSGFRFPKDPETRMQYSALHFFNREGIILEGNSKPTPNHDRVFLAAAMDDKMVLVENTLKAIEKLNLPKDNYKLYPKGKHMMAGNGYDLSIQICDFLTRTLS